LPVSAGTAFVDIAPKLDGFSAALEGGLSGPLNALKSKFSSLGAVLPVAGIVAGAAAIGVGFFELGSKFDEAYDKIRIGTGKTGAALTGLENDFKKVVVTVPTDFGKASDAVSKLASTLQISGKPLQGISEQFLELSRITKTDLSTNITAGTDALKNFGVPVADMPGKLDKLFQASQASGKSFADIAGTTKTLGPVMRALGFDFDSTVGFVTQLSKAGVDAGPVMAGLRKSLATLAKDGEDPRQAFKRLTDEIKNTKDPIEATQKAVALFGARAGPVLASQLREGKISFDDLSKSLGSDTILKAGKDTQDFAEKWELFKNRVLVALEPIAIRVFNGMGTAMDKLGPLFGKVADAARKFLDAFRGGSENPFAKISSSVGGLEGVALHLGEVFGRVQIKFKEWQPTLERIGAFIQANLRPILIGLGIVVVGLISPFALVVAGLVAAYVRFEAFRNVVNTVAVAVAKASAAIVDQLGHAVAWVQKVWPQISEAIGHVMTVIGIYVRAGLEVVRVLWDTYGTAILTVVRTVWDFIKNIIQGALTIVRGVIQTVLALINGDWGKAWDGIKLILSGVWEVMKSYVMLALGLIRGIIEAALGQIRSLWSLAWNALTGIVSGALNAVRGAVSAGIEAVIGIVRALPGAIAGLFHAAWDALTGIVSAAWGGIRGAVASGVGDVVATVRGLPGQIAGALGNLAGLLFDAGRQIIEGLIHGIKSAAGGVIGAITSAIPGAGFLKSLIPHFASGVQNFSGGLALVGEQGPELTVLPRGASVVPAAPTAQMLRSMAAAGGSSAPVTNNIEIVVPGAGNPEAVADAVYRKLNVALRTR
jgi:hypothetical protein